MTKNELEDKFEDCFDQHTHASDGGYGADTTHKNALWQSFAPNIYEYSKRKCIEFSEWKAKEGYVIYDGHDRWISPVNHSDDVLTTEQLYNIFLKKTGS